MERGKRPNAKTHIHTNTRAQHLFTQTLMSRLGEKQKIERGNFIFLEKKAKFASISSFEFCINLLIRQLVIYSKFRLSIGLKRDYFKI